MDIRFINVEHSIKFRNLHEAQKEANRLKMTMDRFAKKTKIPFTCVFAVSELSLKFGEYVFFHNGKKGRPKRQLVSKLKPFQYPETVLPHLHILIAYTEKEKLISDKIVSSITKKFGVESSRAFDITNNKPLYFFQYIVRQAHSLRFVDDFTNTISLDFKKMSRLSIKQKDNIYFHNLYRNDSRIA